MERVSYAHLRKRARREWWWSWWLDLAVATAFSLVLGLATMIGGVWAVIAVMRHFRRF